MEVLYKEVFEKFETNFYELSSPLLSKDELSSSDFSDIGWRIKYSDEKNPLFNYLKNSYDQADFIQNYGNQMCAVNVKRLTFVVEKFIDKISIKMFTHYKHREAGKPFFRKSSGVSFITYKFDTNDLYYGTISRGNKKKSVVKKVRRNYFGGPKAPFNSMFISLNHELKTYLSIEKYGNMFKAIFNDSMSKFLEHIPSISYLINYNNFTDNINNLDSIFYENYLKTRNIKYPNNFRAFIDKTPAPSKRLLKKFNNKFVDCFMYNKKMNGDKLKKILHNSEVINEILYENLLRLLGDDFVKNQSYEDLKTVFNYMGGYNFRALIFEGSKTEKKRVFSTLVDLIRKDGSITSFIDHISFYQTINQYEKIRWLSHNLESFVKEHVDWSDKVAFYKNGLYYRTYNLEFVKEVQNTIFNNYYPVILTESKEYIEESSTQSNCVKTYIDNPSSLIISVRQGSSKSENRVTIEYRISKHPSKKDGVILKRVQSLGKFNSKLSNDWNQVLEVLDERINGLVNQDKFTLPKIRHISTTYNYESDCGFNEKNHLVWLSPVRRTSLTEIFF